MEGLEFGEDGLTDRGWESALESARKALPGDHRRTSLRTPSHRKSPLTPGGPSFSSRRTPIDIGSSSDRLGNVPPWLQSSVERGIVEGWLRKRTRRGRWVRRWYLLDSTGIYYSHSPPSSSGSNSKFVKLVDARTLGAKKCRSNHTSKRRFLPEGGWTEMHSEIDTLQKDGGGRRHTGTFQKEGIVRVLEGALLGKSRKVSYWAMALSYSRRNPYVG